MKIFLFMLCSLFSVQVALAQEKTVDSITIAKSNILISQKVEKERVKKQKAQEKELKSAEKAQKKAEKAQKLAEKELRKSQKAIAKRADLQKDIDKAKSQIAKQQKDWNKDQDKYDKLKNRGNLSDKDELKWSGNMLKHQSKSLKLKTNLEKAENKFRKL